MNKGKVTHIHDINQDQNMNKESNIPRLSLSKNTQGKSSDRRLIYEKNEIAHENEYEGYETNRSNQNNKILNDIMSLGDK